MFLIDSSPFYKELTKFNFVEQWIFSEGLEEMMGTVNGYLNVRSTVGSPV